MIYKLNLQSVGKSLSSLTEENTKYKENIVHKYTITIQYNKWFMIVICMHMRTYLHMYIINFI